MHTHMPSQGCQGTGEGHKTQGRCFVDFDTAALRQGLRLSSPLENRRVRIVSRPRRGWATDTQQSRIKERGGAWSQCLVSVVGEKAGAVLLPLSPLLFKANVVDVDRDISRRRND